MPQAGHAQLDALGSGQYQSLEALALGDHLAHAQDLSSRWRLGGMHRQGASRLAVDQGLGYQARRPDTRLFPLGLEIEPDTLAFAVKPEIEGAALGLIGTLEKLGTHPLLTEQVARTVVAEADADGIQQWKDHEDAHAGQCREDVAMTHQLALAEHYRQGSPQHQEQQREHPLPPQVERHHQPQQGYHQRRHQGAGNPTAIALGKGAGTMARQAA